MNTTRIHAALCASALCALTACSTTKPRPDVLTIPQPAVDEHVKTFLLDPNPGFVMRGRMNAWTELAPTLDMLAQRVPDDKLADLLEELGGGGPVAAFEGLVGDDLPPDFPDLSLIDREGTGWLRVGVTASAQTWGLLDLGVGLMSPYEPLKFWTVEALIPSTDPAKLATELNIGELQAEVAGAYVHVWNSIPVPGVDGYGAVGEVETLEQTLRPWRLTPALARFLSEDAPGALYVRAEDTRLLAAAGGVTQMMRAIRFASAESKQMLVAQGLSAALLAISLTPRSVTEFEDHALLLGGDAPAEAAFVDVVSTRTAFGRKVQAAGASTTASLPTISDAAVSPERTILDASYSFHAGAVDDLYAPIARVLHDPSKPMGQRHVRNVARDMSEVGPLGLLSMIATSPTFIAGVFSSMADPRLIGDARPLAARVRVAQSSAGQIPFGAAAAVAFTGDTSTLEKQINSLLERIPPGAAELFTIAFTPGEAATTLTVVFNLDGEVFGAPAALAAAQGSLRFDAAPLGNMSAEAKMFGALGKIHVQSLPGASTSFVRASLSRAPLAAPATSAYVFDAASNPDPCVDVVARTAAKTLEAVSRALPRDRVKLFARYGQDVDACAEKVESPYWDIARARGETFPYFLGDDYAGALAAYTKACEDAGDEAACAGQKHLERVGPPAPPMGAPDEGAPDEGAPDF